MITQVNINELELNEFIAQGDSTQRCKATFPMFAAHGTRDTATVYFELDPGENLGTHTDSAEELLFIIEGTAEVTVGDMKSEATAGSIALVPKLMPHDLRNAGPGKMRVLGFFGGANNIVATFEKTWDPVNSNMVDTSQMY
jgi:quercetin dioxygenase-like cupin family protein